MTEGSLADATAAPLPISAPSVADFALARKRRATSPSQRDREERFYLFGFGEAATRAFEAFSTCSRICRISSGRFRPAGNGGRNS